MATESAELFISPVKSGKILTRDVEYGADTVGTVDVPGAAELLLYRGGGNVNCSESHQLLLARQTRLDQNIYVALRCQ